MSDKKQAEPAEATPRVQTHCGFCAIIGAPNAGKSTLVNQLTGSKVSIVSHKVQTTRARIRAIAMEGSTQIVLVDTLTALNGHPHYHPLYMALFPAPIAERMLGHFLRRPFAAMAIRWIFVSSVNAP